jgi:hypothetical protein
MSAARLALLPVPLTAPTPAAASVRCPPRVIARCLTVAAAPDRCDAGRKPGTTAGMQEPLPGLLAWTTFHDGIRTRVSSHYVEPAGALIDPRVPEEGMNAFAGRQPPQQVVLTSGLHARHAVLFAEAFGCVIRASPEALERVGGELDAEPYSDGDELAPGITAIQIGRICPDEYALHIAVAEGVIAFADALNSYGDGLAFFSDALLGDDPDTVKAGLADALRGLLTRDFDHLLFAHGEPLIGGGKAALRDFLKRRDAGEADV